MTNIKKGIIVNIDSHESVVYDQNDKTYANCLAKGNIKRNSKESPLVGDYVTFDVIANDKGYITKIEPRKNEIHRPKMANIDQIFIVSALKEPNLNTYIIDKYIAFLELNKIEPILLFTKPDLVTDKNDSVWQIIDDYKKMDYQVFVIDNKKPNKEILDSLEKIMVNKISLFTGQTGAGKTSTLNNFLSFEDQQKTNEISQALNRGKHTTTKVTLYVINDNIYLADSPGFSSFTLKGISLDQIRYAFRAFEKYQGECKFNDCVHLNEKQCKIKEEVKEKNIPQFLYDDYVKMIEEVKKEEETPWKNTF
ncbi:ribosome small subunit-dependent GTPase A [Mesoplasma lactucae]|uniref:Small ribosomal subunit biogenesis GTPase RsgA n=1 Tax=Mesoplasma lactucae ATCC 49193 TaxID=81460 RepID=A0A291IS22_9MOLU|nr:ribosome small subunit-dependent GTPase A [Mesoplasma lactucae]ATG97538.1 ribosome small subunit-dependent GTPase A [Mesoplasma lactucae ATCC 49193]ATZ20004.1 ribosome biogenesis GTPase [Mesoplasma lactucae ATCC 49193]MCL8217045.1 Small ribosomal subunit biogenesis GTPase RsgA [Mesoplasma lactucae ATCC 49193]